MTCGVLAQPIRLQNATATYSQTFSADLSVAFAIDDDPDTGWAIGTADSTKSETAAFETVEDIPLDSGVEFLFQLKCGAFAGYQFNNLGRFRLSATSDDRSEFADGLATGGDVTANWEILEPILFSSAGGATLTKLPDNSILASGINPPDSETYTVVARSKLALITGFRLETMEDDSLPDRGPGRSFNGNFVLYDFSVTARPVPGQNLLLNGSFESPTVPTNTFQGTTPTSWTWTSSAGLIHNGNNGSIWPLPQDGQQYVDIGNESIYALSQAFSITNLGGYVLRWYDSAGHSGGLTTSPYTVAVLTGALETVTSTNLDAYNATPGVWVPRAVQLTLGPGIYTLRFRAEGVSNGIDSLIDNVILERSTDVLPGTPVSGTIVSQVWTATNSPYRVAGDIQVAGLTIQPGVTVIFSGNYVFEIAGTLKAIGTPTAPVVFTGLGSGWQGIYFNQSSPGSVLAYCTISNSVNSGIRIVDSNPSIANCVIANNGGVNGGGIYASLTVGDLVLENCTISNNTATSNGGGVRAILGTNNTLRMDGCFLSGNVANPKRASGNGSSYVGGGIYVSGSSFLENCVVRTNTCYALSGTAAGSGVCFGGGIYSDTGSTDVRNCVISGNEAQAGVGGGGGASVAWGGGIYISSGLLNMANSIISSNITSASTMGGGGVYIESAVHNSSILNCTLAYNNTEGLDSRTTNTSVMNSILFFNTGGGTQVVGVTNVTYCDVQNGFAGTGNIAVNPIFQSTSDLIIVPGSLCIDKGSTNAAYNDVYFPPSLGSSRNDMGAHGGSGAGARLRVEAWPQVAVFFLGGVPGYNYQIQASADLSNWQTVKQVQIAHLGDYASFLEPGANNPPYRFYRLNVGQ